MGAVPCRRCGEESCLLSLPVGLPDPVAVGCAAAEAESLTGHGRKEDMTNHLHRPDFQVVCAWPWSIPLGHPVFVLSGVRIPFDPLIVFFRCVVSSRI